MIMMWIAENLLKGSIATEGDSQLSGSGGATERVHATVVRFASDEENDFNDDDNEEVWYWWHLEPFALSICLSASLCLPLSASVYLCLLVITQIK